MRDGIPSTYHQFRLTWSIVHVVLIALLALLVGIWWFSDNNGSRFIENWWSGSVDVWSAVFHLIPFPWEQ